MKKRILLIDESLTVQKVVSLTLDKNKYALAFAKSRNEALKHWSENPPDLILVGDQVPEINASSFPKEMEVWLGKNAHVPPMILITNQDTREQKNYAAVLKKPFAPSSLQSIVQETLASRPNGGEEEASPDEYEDQRLQKIFNDTFADESHLVRETFKAEEEASPLRDQPPAGSVWGDTTTKLWESEVNGTASAPKKVDDNLWGGSAKSAPEPRLNMTAASAGGNYAANPSASHVATEQDVLNKLQGQDLNEIVDRVLNRIVPPIVERLVQERLDQLLKAQEEFVELKP